MTPSPSIEQSHLEHKLWINELEFYREEIAILEKHILEIQEKNTREQITDTADYYVGQLHRYRQKIDELEIEINEAEKLIALFVQSNQDIDVENVKVGDQNLMRKKIIEFKNDYKELKKKITGFEVEWM